LIGDARDLAKAISETVPLKEAYEDVAQPGARQAGVAIAQVGALVNSALRPLRTIQLSWNTIFDRLDGWLVSKLSGVPPEEIAEAPPNVVGGVITGLLFVQDEESLRDMFVQLLATGMTKSGSHLAHPAFAEFIKQMTPLEARLVRAMRRHSDIASVTIRVHDRKDGVERAYPHRALSSEMFMKLLERPPSSGWGNEVRLTAVDVPSDAPPSGELATAFGNLERLGLVRSSTEITFTDTTRYLKVAMCERAMVLYDRIEKDKDAFAGLHPGILSVTDLGKRFMRACLPRRKRDVG
jgi:hypothetical protein